MRLLRWALGIVLGVGVLLGITAFLVSRLADGPVSILAGGPFTSGELVEVVPDDWSFVTDVDEIELQLLEPPRSRITWVVVHRGRAYVPCGFLDVPLWKQWPHEAERDGRALLRLDGRLYPVQAERVTDLELHAELGKLSAAKYGFGTGEPPDPDQVWFFRLSPRAQGA
jgi:hypothetical protein